MLMVMEFGNGNTNGSEGAVQEFEVAGSTGRQGRCSGASDYTEPFKPRAGFEIWRLITLM